MSKLIQNAAVAAVALTLAAAPAYAAINQVTISNVAMGSQFGSAASINAAQQALLNDFFRKPFSVTFQYDTASVGVAGVHSVSLVSATANGNSSIFAGFSASLRQSQASFNPTWDVMDFILTRNQHGSAFATTQAYFTLVDAQGGLFTNINTLPSGIINSPPILDQVNGEIRINNGSYSLFGGNGTAIGQAAPPPGPGPGGVPEPATWAMMLIGFFGLGGLVRRQRRALAAA